MQKTYNKKVPLKAKSFKFFLIVSTKTEVIASTSWTEDNVSFNFIKKYIKETCIPSINNKHT